MSVWDFLVRKEPLRQQRNTAQDFAREQYDPNVLNPQLDVFRQMATEGIDEGLENTARTRTLSSLFRDQDFSLYGGNQGQALAGAQARDQGAMQALAGFEGQLTEADIRAQQQGRQGLAQTQTQARQIQSQQDAAIKEADLQYEAEVERRGQQIGQTVFGIGSALAMTPFGAVAGTPDVVNEAGEVIKEGVEGQQARSLVERGLGALFSGNRGEETPTETAMGLSNFLPSQDGGTQSTNQPQIDLQGLIDMGPQLQAMMPELNVMDGPTQQTRNESLDALNNVMSGMQQTGVFDQEQEPSPYSTRQESFSSIPTGGSWDSNRISVDEDEGLYGQYIRQRLQGDVDPTMMGEQITSPLINFGRNFGPVGEFATQATSIPIREFFNALSILGRGTQGVNFTGN